MCTLTVVGDSGDTDVDTELVHYAKKFFNQLHGRLSAHLKSLPQIPPKLGTWSVPMGKFLNHVGRHALGYIYRSPNVAP